MANDLIKMLLQAEVDTASIKNIQQQLNSVQQNIKPIKVSVSATGSQSISNMTDALEKLENVTKKNLMLDLQKMSNRYKNLVDSKDVTNIKSMINSLNHTDPKLGHNIDLIKVKMKEVSVGAEQSRRSLDLANKSAMSFGESMKQAAYKFGIWSAVTASYYKVIREIATGVRFVTEMDTALTEIGMVTNQNREQVAGLAKEYNNLAKEMKVLTSEITSGAVEFYRQGLSQEEVMDRLRVTTMYSKVANLEFTQSAELLTATVNSMGIDIERAADVFTYLGDATATGADEIGIGFSKTSGAAAALGVEFEKVASWIAVISSRTRESAESIGHSINTMLSRLSRITTTGFNEEDDTKINDVAKALNTVGIALTDETGNFRNFGTILDEINGKWKGLDDQTRSYLANVMAGTRQQSRFFNLMEGYAESIGLYEEALESAGTAQSKFNLYLESNQATLDTFRTTIEGLWTTIIDSDSLMSIVRAGTSFIELLDSMVQKFGTVGSILNILIPLIGVKFVWAIRAAYIEMVKLQATGSMSAFMPTTKILGQIIGQMLGLKVAAGGATVAVGGLTLATAGLTAGIGLIVFALVKWAQKSQEAKQAFADALDNSQKLNEEVQTLENLAQKQEELTKIENKSAAQKEELLKVQRELAKLYPQLATGIDSEGNKIADNLEMTKQLTEEKRKLLEQELLVIKTTANTRLPQLRKELADMQNEADEIQNRLTSGNTVETEYIEGYAIQIDKTKELKDRLLELINAQKENYEETAKLEDGVKSYNKILEENAERQKWATVEELKGLASKAKTTKQLEDIEKQLKDLGFTSDDVANILGGNIDFVKDKYKELDIQQIINLQTIETLDATQKQTWINYLNNSKTATQQLIADTKARIQAIMAEAQALAALTGGKVNASVVSKKGEIDPKTGLFSNLATQAQNQAIDAQRELVNLESNLKEIEKALTNVNNIEVTSGGIGEGKGGGSTKDQYSAESDRYQKLNLFLDKNNVLLAKNKTLQELATEGSAEQLTLIQEENALYKERQGLLHQLNQQQREEALQLQKDLSAEGFKFTGSGDNATISNLDNIQGKSKKVEEMFKRFNELQSNLIPQSSQQWWDYQKTIVDNMAKIKDAIQSHIDELGKLKDELADFDLSGKIAELDEQLDAAKFNHWIESLILGLERYNDKTELLSFKLSLFDEEDYGNRSDVIGDLFNASKDKLKSYREEWDRLSAQTPQNANEANQIASAMKQVQQGMREAFVATRDYQRQLEQLQFDSISNEFAKANKQLELQLSIIDNNLQNLQDGILPDFSLDMVMPIPDFSDIFDETASENEKIYNEQADFEKQIQSLKKQSLEMQLAEAEDFYEEEKAKLIKHYKDLVKQIADKEAEILELQKFADEQQKAQLQNSAIEIQNIVDTDLNTLEGLYVDSWGNIVGTVRDSVAQIKQLVSQANSAIASMGSAPSSSSGGSTGSNSGSSGYKNLNPVVNVNPDGKAPSGLPVGTTVKTGGGDYQITKVKSDGSYESKKVPKYAKGGTHQGGNSLVGEEGIELGLLPSGKAIILGKNGSELVDIPKGTQVIPHEETKDILSHTGNIDGKTIPKYKDGTGEAIPQYAIGTGFIAGIVGAVASTLASTVSKVSGTSAKLKDTTDKLNKANNQIDRLNNKIDDLSNVSYASSTPTASETSEFDKIIESIKPDFAVEMSSTFKEGYDKYIEDRKINLEEIVDLQKKYLESTDEQITKEEILSKIDAQMLEDARTQSWLKVDLLEQMKASVDSYVVALKEQYDASIESGNTELARQIFEEYNNMLTKQMQVEKQIQSAIKERYNMEFALMDKKIAKEKQIQDSANKYLNILKELNPDDYGKFNQVNESILQSEQNKLELLKQSSAELKAQLELLEVGSSEWNLINDRINEVNDSMMDSTLEIIKLNKEILRNKYEQELSRVEKDLFGGQTQEEAQKELDEKKKFQQDYVGGLEKELLVSKLISQARKDDVQLTKEELAILNQSGNLERVKLERIEKQLQVRAAEQRLENIRNQKSIQQLTKNADGTFDFKYVADQDALDQAEIDLKEAKVGLMNWERDLETSKQQEEINAKSKYLDELRKLTEKSLQSEINSMMEFYTEANRVSSEFFEEVGTNVNTTIDALASDFSIFLGKLNEFRASIENFTVPPITVKVTPLPGIISNEKPKSFDTGGYTGSWDSSGKLAMLHEKEIVLNQSQSKDFSKLVANMPDILKFLDTDKLTDVLKSAVLSTINIAIPKLPQVALSGGSGGVSQFVTVKEIVFPNVKDAKEIETSIKTLSTYADQWANQK